MRPWTPRARRHLLPQAAAVLNCLPCPSLNKLPRGNGRACRESCRSRQRKRLTSGVSRKPLDRPGQDTSLGGALREPQLHSVPSRGRQAAMETAGGGRRAGENTTERGLAETLQSLSVNVPHCKSG